MIRSVTDDAAGDVELARQQTQQELGFKAKTPVVSQVALAGLLNRLGDGRWHTAASLGAYSQTDRRQLRACADASAGRVLSGQQGYKLTSAATLDECNHAANWLEHQAREMQARSIQIRRVAHGRAGQEAV